MPKIDTPITATIGGLDRLLQHPLPLLLVVYRRGLPWEQALRQIAKAEAGRLLLAKVDVADDPALAARYDLSDGEPLLLAYKEGQEVARRPAATLHTLQSYAAYVLGRAPKPQEASPPAQPLPVSDGDFRQKVLQSTTPVLVDFWAAWCGPCRMIAPSLEKLAAEFAGRLTVAKLNVDENPQTAGQYRVQGIPMLLIFKDGQVVDKLVGAAPEPTLRQFVMRHVS